MSDFVSCDLARKLKEKGFKFNKDYRLDRFFMGNEVNTPIISQVLKWMREEKNIHIAVDIMKAYPAGNLIYWGYNIVLVDKYEVCHHDWNGDSYEEAAIAGIEYILDNLI